MGEQMSRLSNSKLLSLHPGVEMSSVMYGSSANVPAYTWAASYNRLNEIDFLMDEVFARLEELDNVRTINVVADGCQGLGSGLSSGLLQELREVLPNVSLRSIFVLPLAPSSIGGVCGGDGLGTLNLLLASHAALSLADTVTLRALDDSLRLAQAEGCYFASGNSASAGAGGSGPTLLDVHAMIAADLLVAAGPRSSSWGLADGWPLTASTVAGAVGRVVDVRSSLWRLVRDNQRNKGGKSKSSAGADYSPLRAMATNLHALHLSAAPSIASLSIAPTSASASTSVLGLGLGLEQQLDVRVASLRLGALDPGNHCLHLSNTVSLASGNSSSSSSSSSLYPLLRWACPRVTWPEGMSIPSPPLQVPSGTSSAAAAAAAAATTSSNSAFPVTSQIAAIAFSCPYAAHALRALTDKGRALLQRRAFVHHFEEFGVPAEELLFAADGLSCLLEEE